MGYRFEAIEIIPRSTINGGKLYGYYDKIEELKSYQWLQRQGIVDGTEAWFYGCSIDKVISAIEFREFFDLYLDDFEKIKGYKLELTEEEYRAYKNNNDKVLTWG